jgi:carboxypeptidase C (cathepsin A)
MKFAILALLLLAVAFAAPAKDLMASPLPGCPQTDFKQYSGYLSVTTEKKFHYVYVESANDPANDPVLFWFNGGPGCSSMIGFIQEHGPCVFYKDSDAKPSANEYSWNKFANMVYLESPAGVGYNQFSGKFHYDDENVSYENLKAVQEFFAAFPELKSNDMYLTGESYAGIYVPYLALRIDEYNQKANDKINLEGFIIGNAVTNWKYDTLPAFIKMGFTHGLIGVDLKDRIDAAGCVFADNGAPPLSKVCSGLLNEFNDAVAQVYPYDIYRPQEEYYSSKVQKMGVADMLKLESDSNEFIPYGSFSGLVRNNVKKRSNGFSAVTSFMNLDATKAALHVSANIEWSECSDIDYSILDKATQWIYPKLQHKYRMAHYSGDTDGVVPTIGTEQWMEDLGWPITKARKAWMAEEYLLGGYTQSREGNLDLITIHGCGHMTPQWKRQPSYVAISKWIADEDLPRV